MFVSLPWRQSRAAEHGLGKNKTGAGRRDEEPQVAAVALQECEYITNTLPSPPPHPTMAQVQGRRGPNIFCKYCYQISTQIMHITLKYIPSYQTQKGCWVPPIRICTLHISLKFPEYWCCPLPWRGAVSAVAIITQSHSHMHISCS